jgi:hypothetical protein
MPDENLPGDRSRGEDEFFHQHNQKLIEERRKKLDAHRSEEERLHKKDKHWMKCPKCGHDLQEIDLHGIHVDQCTEKDCQGVFFEKGELELLMEIIGSKGFLGQIRSLFW